MEAYRLCIFSYRPGRHLVFLAAARRAVASLGYCLVVALLAACGGGGGGASAEARPSASLTGYVAKGPVAGAEVKLYRVSASGNLELLESARTDAAGFYRFAHPVASEPVLLLEATAGNYVDEISGTRVPLDGKLRAVLPGSSSPLSVTLSPFSELAVRAIEGQAAPIWIPAAVQEVNHLLSRQLGVPDYLAIRPVDLRSETAARTATREEFALALSLGGFAGLMHRLDLAAMPARLEDGIQALRYALLTPYDGRYSPLYVLGLLDYAEQIAYPADFKRELKSYLVLRRGGASEAEIAAATPRGRSSITSTAPMQDNVFRLVPGPGLSYGEGPIGTHFDERGGLVAYQLGTQVTRWRYLYSASIGELYADGEVGVGRWNGGVTFETLDGPRFEQFVDPQILRPDNGLPYAVVLPSGPTPACGMRQMPLVAATAATDLSGSDASQPVIGLTPDSAMAVQYLTGGTYLAFDIGVQFQNGMVVRVGSNGGLAAPWASGLVTRAGDLFNGDLTPASGSNLSSVEISGVLGGSAGRKAGVMLRMGVPQVGSRTIAAAFSGAAQADASGCALATTGDGTAIVPSPPDAEYRMFIYGPALGALTIAGGPVVQFSASGALQRTGNLEVLPDSPTFELQGAEGAVIGRVQGRFLVNGIEFDRWLVYGGVRPLTTQLTSGARRYRLLAASAVVGTVNGPGGEGQLPLGHVANAALDIDFGTFPRGTDNPNYGSVRISVSGSIAGTEFTVANSLDSNKRPLDFIYYRDGGGFQGSGEFAAVEGLLAAPSGDYAVVGYTKTLGNGKARGVLLFARE
jgi:hypothetical protein